MNKTQNTSDETLFELADWFPLGSMAAAPLGRADRGGAGPMRLFAARNRGSLGVALFWSRNGTLFSFDGSFTVGGDYFDRRAVERVARRSGFDSPPVAHAKAIRELDS
jgi:hypothetical protein